MSMQSFVLGLGTGAELEKSGSFRATGLTGQTGISVGGLINKLKVVRKNRFKTTMPNSVTGALPKRMKRRRLSDSSKAKSTVAPAGPAPEAPPEGQTEEGLTDWLNKISPTHVGLGLGIPAGLMGYLAASQETPMAPPPNMMNMFGPGMMPGMSPNVPPVPPMAY